MASLFDTTFVADAMPTLLEQMGETVTIARPASQTYNTATGRPEAIAGSVASSVSATAIIDKCLTEESDDNGLRAKGTVKISSMTEIRKGDTITAGGIVYRVKEVDSSISGVYEAEAAR